MIDNTATTGEQLSNAVLGNIYTRRSVRNFTDKEVSDEIIKEIIRAGTYTPTAMNSQPWRFVVVKNRRLIEEYDDRAKKLFIAAFKDTTIPTLAGYVEIYQSLKFDYSTERPCLSWCSRLPRS